MHVGERARMQARLPLLFLLIFLFFPLFPSVSAQNSSAPTSLIVDELDYQTSGSGFSAWQAFVNVTFERSPTDNGTWTYALNGTSSYDSSCTTGSCDFEYNRTPKTIPNRGNWAWLGTGFFVSAFEPSDRPTNQWGVRNVTLVPIAPDGTRGAASCSIAIDFKALDLSMYLGPIGSVSPGQNDGTFSTLTHKVPNDAGVNPFWNCGANATLQQASGVGAIVDDAYADTNGTSTVNVTWLKSPSDTNFSFDYYVLRRYNDPPSFTTEYIWNYDSTTDGDDKTTLHAKSFTGTDSSGVVNPVWFGVLVRDNLTHQRSLDSCYVSVLEGQRDSNAACGRLSAPGANPAALSDTPIFPGIDVGVWANAMGMSTTIAEGVLGIIWTIIFIAFGFWVGKKYGALGGFALGFGSAALFGLFPPWLLVGIFALFAGAAVYFFSKSQEGTA